ncbi:MAG: hypothetical protein DSY91_02275 [Deltaproteobacteria bacterium]|nr:MAG: hypothetical protein DSY91_02275 [Deltaproteobacteria bacterium]
MANLKHLLFMVNSGADKPFNHYAAYVVAFAAKYIGKIEDVTIYYGAYGIEMTEKGKLKGLEINDDIKKLVAGQIEGITPGDLPDNLEDLGRFLHEKMGVRIVSCATFHVIEGVGKDIDDKSNIVDFIEPVTIPEAAEIFLTAEKIFDY